MEQSNEKNEPIKIKTPSEREVKDKEVKGDPENKGCLSSGLLITAGVLGLIFEFIRLFGGNNISGATIFAGVILICWGLWLSGKEEKKKAKIESTKTKEASLTHSIESEKQARAMLSSLETLSKSASSLSTSKTSLPCSQPSASGSRSSEKTTASTLSPIVNTKEPKPPKGERYKKFKAWVEESFVHKTIFFIAAIIFSAALLFSIYKGLIFFDKIHRISTGVVYVTRDGQRYHLYANCSNMAEPIEMKESKAIEIDRYRCLKCYSSVMRIESWSIDTAFEIGVPLLLFLLFLVLTVVFKKSKKIDAKFSNKNKKSRLVNIGTIITILCSFWLFYMWNYNYGPF